MNVGGGGFRKHLMCVVSEASWLHMTALIPAPLGHYTPQSLQFQTQMAHPICNVGSLQQPPSAMPYLSGNFLDRSNSQINHLNKSKRAPSFHLTFGSLGWLWMGWWMVRINSLIIGTFRSYLSVKVTLTLELPDGVTFMPCSFEGFSEFLSWRSNLFFRFHKFYILLKGFTKSNNMELPF